MLSCYYEPFLNLEKNYPHPYLGINIKFNRTNVITILTDKVEDKFVNIVSQLKSDCYDFDNEKRFFRSEMEKKLILKEYLNNKKNDNYLLS